MNRRRFLHQVGVGTLALGWTPLSLSTASDNPELSLTIDDPNINPNPLLSPAERNEKLLTALQDKDLQAALFVCGMRVDSENGRKLVERWGANGHIVANHSYSHLYYNSRRVSFKKYSKDILRGEKLICDLPGFHKFFRFPFLKEGETKEKRDAMRNFLSEQGYRTGHVTIDNSDWYIDQRLRKRLEANPGADLAPYKTFYLEHIGERANYYHDLAVKVTGSPVKHTLLLHHNLLNALFLSDLIQMFQEKHWRLIHAGEAFNDPIYSPAPDIVPAGESLIWALAKETGRFDHILRYPGEDSVYEKDRMDALGL